MGCGSSSESAAAPGAGRRDEAVVANPNNRRVRPVAVWTEPVPITQQQLAMKRVAFWESQSAGRPAVWANIKVAAESMLNNDFELANTVLEAADLRVPNSDLSVCYDSLGQMYQVPRFAFSTPSNVVSDAEFSKMNHAKRRPHSGPVLDIPLVCRVSSTSNTIEQDVRLSVLSSTTVAELKAALHDLLRSGKLDQIADDSVSRPNRWTGRGLPPSRQRIMFRGRELPDDSYMQESSVTPGSVLQVFVRLD